LGALEGAGSLLQLLEPPALEQLALLNALYLQGGLAVPLDTSCAGAEGALRALLAHAESEGKIQLQDTLRHGPAASEAQWLLGSAHHGLVVAGVELPGARAASQFHHAVFQKLAKASATAQLRDFIGGEKLPPEAAGCAGASVRKAKSTLVLQDLGYDSAGGN
jgi:hypothetical protein